MRPARLLFAAGVLWVFFVLLADFAMHQRVTPGGIVSAVLGLVILGALLLMAGVFKSSSNDERNQAHGHRQEGDPR